MEINNSMELIDSRDVTERIEELEEILGEELDIDDTHFEDDTLAAEYKKLLALQEQCETIDDWEYGTTLIHEDYFEEYMDEMIEDCYEFPKNLPFWMSLTIDYDALTQDYTEVDFDGVTYYVR